MKQSPPFGVFREHLTPTLLLAFFIIVGLILPVLVFAFTSLESDPTFEDHRNSIQTQTFYGTEQFSGSGVYDIPIVVPPGRNGRTPEIKLSYSSQSAGDDANPFGYGWDVNIPYIQRMNKEGTDHLFTSDYYFSTLDGEIASTSLGVYRALFDNGRYTTYVYSTSTNVWLAFDKGGLTYTFGSTTNSQQNNASSTSNVYKWMVSEIRDKNNNYISFTYYKDANQIYPDTITYTGNGTTDGTLKVEFVRETRPIVAVSSRAGFLVQSNYRIREVRM